MSQYQSDMDEDDSEFVLSDEEDPYEFALEQAEDMIYRDPAIKQLLVNSATNIVDMVDGRLCSRFLRLRIFDRQFVDDIRDALISLVERRGTYEEPSAST